MHECTDVEFKGSWARFHLDMGTADELAFDILINMLVGFSAEVAGFTQVGTAALLLLRGDTADSCA